MGCHNTKEEVIDDNSLPGFTEIAFEECIQMLESKESFILFLTKDGCPYCEIAEPILEGIVKNEKVEIKTIHFDQIDTNREDFKDLYNKFLNLIQDAAIFDKERNEYVLYTPTFIHIQKGKVIASHTGLVDSFSLQSEQSQMNDRQVMELIGIYKNIIHAD